MFADSSARACARNSPVFVVAIAIFAGSLFFATPASAVTPEQLLEVLRKKGVINDEEYEILSGKKNAGAAAVPASAPPVAAAKEEPKTPATAAPAKPKEEIAAKFKEGITWESADKSTWIGLRGRVEADYRHYLGDDALGADTWDVRRAYLAVEGKFYDDIDFRVRMNFADGADAFVEGRIGAGLKTDGAGFGHAVANFNFAHVHLRVHFFHDFDRTRRARHHTCAQTG